MPVCRGCRAGRHKVKKGHRLLLAWIGLFDVLLQAALGTSHFVAGFAQIMVPGTLWVHDGIVDVLDTQNLRRFLACRAVGELRAAAFWIGLHHSRPQGLAPRFES
jgi:hypothetical protein